MRFVTRQIRVFVDNVAAEGMLIVLEDALDMNRSGAAWAEPEIPVSSPL
ncbi:MAG: hypothetical protein O2960_24915 [Verrucomicrobia bacterium]|nr:hypothetical protein [Verrucomicrobiota bacterium]